MVNPLPRQHGIGPHQFKQSDLPVTQGKTIAVVVRVLLETPDTQLMQPPQKTVHANRLDCPHRRNVQ